MKPALQLKIGQSLTMTPQLQQAIRLLQLSTLDLQQEIQEALESNPMLEVEDEFNSGSDTEGNADSNKEEQSKPESEGNTSAESQESELESYTATAEDSWQDSIPEDLPVDSGWDDVYQESLYTQSSAPSDDDGSYLEQRGVVTETLQDHLLWQLNLSGLPAGDRMIAEAIIDSIDPDGYLSSPIEEIYEGLQSRSELQSGEYELEIEDVQAVQGYIQSLDPIGCGVKDLQECLLVQLETLDTSAFLMEKTRKLITLYLDLLGSRDFTQLMRRLRVKEPELQEIIALIRSLNPKPGSSISTEHAEYIAPDLFVTREEDHWKVDLNPDIAPKIRIHGAYSGLIKRADNSRDNTFMKNQLQEARWFLKSLHSRNETLLKVGIEIVKRQQAFLEIGEEGMKPLVLHDIADAIGMHESTISRVTTQKYIHTPRGIFELKYFFSSHVGTTAGGEASSTAIRAMIKKMIADEPPRKPFSDSKLANMLAEQGIKVARRTVAKYREAMNIPPSNERKKLI
ncbi:RNA polymerase factor sigma-54 [Oceanospirillum linum]|uniref:RNA polymerase sigma-54 factor n=1 Tax=Oceanospirillum linum TaxID=966 RepID=A0A1T1H9E1_OCELI|nr:RNA polymerase factor sigma-54 [Oceanospirillum linum]OOV86481.1 RNA polymerase factor sigma-54 [Oceanospirillum linum]SEG34676.1 RNA polymerase, sigma 54 subunit, RpoN/SigL [Oleiphilus messinensis]SMP29539.1 RNA polymerase, sigma 54 subunit, RpoN/SigL [Oceanospirillum linum]